MTKPPAARVPKPSAAAADATTTDATATFAAALAAQKSIRLARDIRKISPLYDVVIVGSGYGGGVAALRMAALGLKVAVLERGREYLPGEFPTSPLSAQKASRVEMGGAAVGPKDALFDVRLGPGVGVVQGSGLGGTSLINANVCLMPDQAILAAHAWPGAARNTHLVHLGYARARTMLQPATLPGEPSAKMKVLGKIAKAVGGTVELAPLHIAFQDTINAAGVAQPACTRCGDCMGGCNVGAKTTVHNTYLAAASRHGAELYTGAVVRRVAKDRDGAWLLFYQLADAESAAPTRAINAHVVILAAGTLGTNEILMRSREAGLPLSDRLGKHVSTNADLIAFGSNLKEPVHGIGIGHPPRAGAERPGPAVGGLIDLRRTASRPDAQHDGGMVLVDAAIQSAMAPLVPLMFAFDRMLGQSAGWQLSDALNDAGQTFRSLVGGAYTGAASRTLPLLAIGHDTAAGEIQFDKDRATLAWPDVAKLPVYGRMNDLMADAIKALGGTFVPNPASFNLLGGRAMTVHPLGGAAMGETRADGVVDDRGRLFDGTAGGSPSAVHDGLYVVDGAQIPRSLGVHPLFTITAMAERAMILLARDLGRASADLPSAEHKPAA